MRILLDAMGSDKHPQPEVEAAIRAVEEFDDELVLVGNRDILLPLLGSHAAQMDVVHAPEVFEMTDKLGPRALRTVQNSMGVGMDLLKVGKADAMVTAGNTGGAMAIALARLGRLKGVRRPALTVLFPVKGGYSVVLDIGANTECKPEYLLQFAVMGSVYAELVLGVDNPRVGLISNGEEAGKGNNLVKETYPLLEKSGLNFVGNIEGKELFGGEVDVSVTDGFTGNVLLKTTEGAVQFIAQFLEAALAKLPPEDLTVVAPAIAEVRKGVDHEEHGGGHLLGTNGVVVIAHGSSSRIAVANAVGMASEGADRDLSGHVAKRLGA